MIRRSLLLLAALLAIAPLAFPQMISDLQPSSAVAGSPDITLTIHGEFQQLPAPTVTWFVPGTNINTTLNVVNSKTSDLTTITATIPASLLTTPETALVSVFQGSSYEFNSLSFTVTPVPLTLTSLSPNTAIPGSPGFTLTVNGTSFTSGMTVTWNGSSLSTSFINSTTLTATVPANLVATAGTASVGVAAEGFSPPAPLTFTINPVLTLTSLSPPSAVAGGPAFTLTLNGAGFTAQTNAVWNGALLVTTFVSANQLTATVPANFIAQAGTAPITAQSSFGKSNSLAFNITTPALTLTSLSPNSAASGSAAFTLTVNGSGFNNSTAVTWNGSTLSTTFVSGVQLTAAVPASLIANSGTASVGVVGAGQTSPTPLTFTITSSLSIISISPTSTAAGGPAFTLTVNATGFNSGAVVYWNSTPLSTTAINNGLAAAVPANLIAQPGSASITVREEGNFTSNAVTFTITPPPLSITSISPNTAVAGSPAFNLTVNGIGFNSSTIINWNSTTLVSTPVSSTQMMAAVPANLLAQVGSATITAQNGTQVSNGVTFTVTSPPLSITSISPNTAVAGSPAFSLTVNGTGFNSSTIINWNSTTLVSTPVSSTQLMAAVPANLVAQVGSATITAQNGTQVSNGVTFTVTSPPLSITSISPNTAVAGSPAFSLTVNGTGFNTNTVINWNGSALVSTFVNATQITATVPANLVAQAGNATVTAQNGTQVSNGVTFTVTAPSLSITSISPNTAAAGSPALSLAVSGTGFNTNTVINWNGGALVSTFVNATQITATVPANLVAQAGSATITAQNATQVSNGVTFTVTAPSLSITSISPNTAVAGSPAFTLTVNGTGFNTNTVVNWNGSALVSTLVNAGQITAAVPANLVAQPGSATITAQNGTQVSNGVTFTVTAPSLSITSISPNTAVAGSAAFNLTVNGTGFNTNTVANWNGSALVSTFVNSTQITAAVPANLVAQPGSATITAQNANQVSNGVTFTVTSRGPTLTSISPNIAIAGGPAFTLTAIGSGFASGAQVTWNGTALSTTFVSTSQLTAAVPANLIATSGSASVGVSVPGQVSPAPLSFAISASLTITSTSPSSVPAGGAAFTLTVTGTGFAPGTTILWNGLALPTIVVNANLMTTTVPSNLIAQQASASITAQNGNLVSNTLTISVTGAQTPITLTSLSPNSVSAGSPALSLTVFGSGFSSPSTGNGTLVTWNGSPLSTAFVSSTQLTALVPATLLTAVENASVSVTGGPQPASLPFTVSSSQTVTLTSISPSTVSAGGPAFTLTVTGTGFTNTTTVTWNGSLLATTFVSATQLTAAVPATLIVAPTAPGAAVAIDVSVPAGQTPPAALPLTIIQGITLTSLSPPSAIAGGAAFTLTVSGTGFASGATVVWNSTSLSTTFVSATQLTVAVSAALIAQVGSASVTVSSGNLVSNALPFAITAPPPVITSISPSTVTAGGPTFTLTVSGTGFVSGAIVSLNGTGLTTTFVSGTQVTAGVPTTYTAQPGTAQITLANPSGPASNAVALTIAAPVPVITSISPSTVVAGGPAFTLTVTGTGFLPGATVNLSSSNSLATTVVSGTQLTAAVPANLIAQAGTAQITVTNTGGAASNAVGLIITPAAPTITSISPTTAPAGGVAFTLTVNGTNFLAGAIVSLNSTPLNTAFISATQLTASVPANLIAQPGTAQITAANTVGAASNAVTLTIASPAPTVTSISPSSVTAGGPAFTLTVSGTGFIAGSNGGAVVSINGTPISTTVVSTTQVTAQVPPSLIAQSGTLQVTVANQGGAQSNALTLTVTPGPPTLTSIVPTSAKVGDPTFTLALTGTGFVQASIAQWNGTPLSTTFVSATQLTATIDAGRLILPATASVTVVNPSLPDGTPQVSNALTFTINPVTPVVSSISPTSVTAGSPALSLTVNGSGFINQTVIQWNTTALTTHFVSATQVTADVPVTLLAQAGTVTVIAVNPGNNVSATFTFTIIPAPPPVITSLSQSSATAGDGAFTLTVTGTGFITGAVVNFGSAALPTTFVSATQITAAVSASVLLTPGTFPVTVQQGSGPSNAINFTVNLPPAPSLRLNPPATAGPATQPTIDFGLNASYPIAMTATVTLTFASNATIPADDPSIQFAAGGRTFTFPVPPNTTTLPPLLIQTGTVSGVITLKVILTAAGVDVTPATGSTATITVPKSAPVIRTVKLIEANGYLEVDVNAYSTTRDVTTAVFTLNPATGGSFTSSVITVPVSAVFTTWYQSAASTVFGSQFTYAQPFTVIGNTNQIQSVTVTLTNSAGTSVSMTSN